MSFVFMCLSMYMDVLTLVYLDRATERDGGLTGQCEAFNKVRSYCLSITSIFIYLYSLQIYCNYLYLTLPFFLINYLYIYLVIYQSNNASFNLSD